MGIFRKKGGKTIFIEGKKKKVDGTMTITNEKDEEIGKMDIHWEGNAEKLNNARKMTIVSEVEGQKVFEDTVDNPNPPQIEEE